VNQFLDSFRTAKNVLLQSNLPWGRDAQTGIITLGRSYAVVYSCGVVWEPHGYNQGLYSRVYEIVGGLLRLLLLLSDPF
jgi:hypothetical protein